MASPSISAQRVITGLDNLRFRSGGRVIEHGVTYWYFRRQVNFYRVSWPLSKWLTAHVRDYDLVRIHAPFSFPAAAGAFWAARRRVPYLCVRWASLIHRAS